MSRSKQLSFKFHDIKYNKRNHRVYKMSRCNPVIISLSVIRLPVQVVPSQANPFLHVQLCEPTKFLHVAFVSKGLEIHSSMSEKIKYAQF